jgi:DNA excision repair protein ERCC-1
VRFVAWEYSDTVADYVLGATTCALFLSLKYHRLHPEYIYNRIRDLRGQFNLRILLTMVDIDNHEETLRELSKTSLINNVTVILCWSAQEAGRYLELYKTFEHAAPTGIKAQQSTSYADMLVDFITVPRSINKTDAIGLVSNFGSVRTAVNAGQEEVGLIAGWGEKKVERWCNSVREPFRIKKAAKRIISTQREEGVGADSGKSTGRTTTGVTSQLGIGEPIAADADMDEPDLTSSGEADANRRPPERVAEDLSVLALGFGEEEVMRDVGSRAARSEQPPTNRPPARKRKPDEEELDDGIMAALNKLRKQ